MSKETREELRTKEEKFDMFLLNLPVFLHAQ